VAVPDFIIAPSLLAADFARLGEEANAVEADADWLHVDVMDNHYVPNLTIGLPVVKSLRKATAMPFDCHLMIEDPERWSIGYAEAGAYNVTFHVECAADPVALARDLRAAGTKAGLAIDRDTPIEPYLDILPRHINAGHLELRVEVDGGIDEDTITDAALAGADAFVAGTAVYGASDPGAAVRALRRRAEATLAS